MYNNIPYAIFLCKHVLNERSLYIGDSVIIYNAGKHGFHRQQISRESSIAATRAKD
jgi:hypothetical protein